ncbi:3-hydroxyacyl-ACP dehydratase [Brevibacillus sp. HB1.4B]|uniref:MaoC/PaaZ C-terminal domain-containing protein n=1 Tax=unclassified Brevibacillus TaxID=2684853 RepID=UPI00036A7D78|nr:MULTISPECIES: MaoC/PaaZ C-terminal domain-containing protein [unclassified Brevibacillus]ATF13341.1 3-hydroxyacyl-ACP dehydratase [Brevibacillus brevis X23]MED1919482.1 MaoC/PaaZ C-terminal domain-containing protein [Bacillus thuringiensis]MDC0759502.1 MaoC/PaaZ C-terminal domain-containing protein [Brevibacillus sp. AG]NRS15412.1 3-hydroxyacyl-ACP dehydratase [Brevibacillus sp. HB1.4B]NTU29740.1 3-hydroxyacyl-ACP dehydratase [Brevibacillus sp. HB1.1]
MIFYEDVSEGYEFPVLEKEPITRVQLVRFAGASGDFHPLHLVEEFAEKAGMKIIAHGMLVMGMLSQGVTSWVSRKNIQKIQVRFSKMTLPGESIQIVGKVLEKKLDNTVVGEVLAKNSEGEVKVSGIFEAKLPSR